MKKERNVLGRLMGSISAKFLDDTCDSDHPLNPGLGLARPMAMGRHKCYSLIYNDDVHSIQESRKLGKDGILKNVVVLHARGSRVYNIQVLLRTVVCQNMPHQDTAFVITSIYTNKNFNITYKSDPTWSLWLLVPAL